MKSTILTGLLLAAALPMLAEWKEIAPGVQYQEFRDDKLAAHVTRIDLTNDEIRVIASSREDNGTSVSRFADKHDAIVAINGDYFNAEMKPIGLTIGPCGQWAETKDTKREGFLAVGDGRARIYRQSEVIDPPESWMETAVSGWPMLVENCEAKSDSQLPGSDLFTRRPHPRTAVALSRNGKTLYFIVADGRREDAPGLTLGELARFIRSELKACSAMNLDGGGSSAMVVDGELVNKPSDGTERRVANHLGVIFSRDARQCDEGRTRKDSRR